MPNDRTPLLGNIFHRPLREQPLHQRALQMARADGELSWNDSIKYFLTASKINNLLIFLPLCVLAQQLHWDHALLFSFSLLALVPLSMLLGLATDELALKSGPMLSGLLNAPFGTVVEMLLGFVALFRNEAHLAHTIMFGAILCNLLVVLGVAFIAGGCKYFVSDFQKSTAYLSSSFALLTCIILALPAVYAQLELPHNPATNITIVSRGSAIILFALYLANLFFRLKTHRAVFKKPLRGEHQNNHSNIVSAILLFVIVPIAIGCCFTYLVVSLDPLCQDRSIGKDFIGWILIPLAVSVPKQLETAAWALSGKMEISINIALGSAIQIAALVLPLLALVGWACGHNAELSFSAFEIAALLISALLVNALVNAGRSNYLQGIMMLAIYAIFAMAFWGGS